MDRMQRIEDEFKSFFEELGPAATAGYKFFNAFKIKINETSNDNASLNEGTIHFYKDFKDNVATDILKDLKTYIKNEKNRLTEGKKNISVASVRQRVIFFITKIHELSIFAFNDRKYLFFYWQTLDDLLI